MPKINKKTLLSSALFSLLFLSIFSFHLVPLGGGYFSRESINELQRLNSKHKMYIDDLLVVGSDQSVENELLSANVFQQTQQTFLENKGLIASVQQSSSGSGKEGIFTLNTPEPLSDDELLALAEEYKRSIPEFHQVEIDQEIDLMADSSVVLDVDSPQVTSKTESVANKTVRIGLIDSGIDSHHEIFQDKKVAKGWNFVTDDGLVNDDMGHGTHIAGIILSQSSEVELFPYKIISKKSGKLSYVLKALSKAIDDKVDIVNMSLGFTQESYALEQMIKKAREQNIIIVAAAGNHNNSLPFYPARYDEVIAVAATDDDYHKTKNSNYGEWVDAAANGYNIFSSLPNNLYGPKSGTSQAAGSVSGFIANLLTESKITKNIDQQELERVMQKQALKFGENELDEIPILSST